ncbi:MAG: hypothetical protein RLO81_08935 [Fulvivirga sp.]|uniref:hypothetical protein n=1 Tax=Fulvivirga sp. TaxID=1931237 RepID=UPI0032EF204C
MNPQQLSIVFIAERGVLERQALALVDSLKINGKMWSECNLYCYSPRKDNLPGSYTINRLRKRGVRFVTEDLNKNFVDYPFSNKIFACEHAERSINTEYLLFLDTDILVLNTFKLFEEFIGDVGICPVEYKKIGTNGQDENMPYWSHLFKYFNCEREKSIITSVSNEEIWPYWNAGVILVKRSVGVFKNWCNNFQIMMENRLIPSEKTFVDQISLAVTLEKYTKLIQLPVSYNYPINENLNMTAPEDSLSSIVFAHYHKVFPTGQCLFPLTQMGFQENDMLKLVKRLLVGSGLYSPTVLNKLRNYLIFSR